MSVWMQGSISWSQTGQLLQGCIGGMSTQKAMILSAPVNRVDCRRPAKVKARSHSGRDADRHCRRLCRLRRASDKVTNTTSRVGSSDARIISASCPHNASVHHALWRRVGLM
jgi:hypothetical protein